MMRPAATISSLALDDNDDGSALVLAAAVAFLQDANIGLTLPPAAMYAKKYMPDLDKLIGWAPAEECIFGRTADENLWLKRPQQGLLRAEGLPSSVHGKKMEKEHSRD